MELTFPFSRAVFLFLVLCAQLPVTSDSCMDHTVQSSSSPNYDKYTIEIEVPHENQFIPTITVCCVSSSSEFSVLHYILSREEDKD